MESYTHKSFLKDKNLTNVLKYNVLRPEINDDFNYSLLGRTSKVDLWKV